MTEEPKKKSYYYGAAYYRPYQKKYRERNAEALVAKTLEWRAENKERYNETQKALMQRRRMTLKEFKRLAAIGI